MRLDDATCGTENRLFCLPANAGKHRGREAEEFGEHMRCAKAKPQKGNNITGSNDGRGGEGGVGGEACQRWWLGLRPRPETARTQIWDYLHGIYFRHRCLLSTLSLTMLSAGREQLGCNPVQKGPVESAISKCSCPTRKSGSSRAADKR